MTISLKHSFTNPKADGPDATIVRPSDWNAEHAYTMATGKLLGRSTASTGVVEELTVGTGLSLSGGTLTSTATGSLTQGKAAALACGRRWPEGAYAWPFRT
jgi:hypothetical protein